MDRAFAVFAGWYAIWCLVGFFVVGLSLPKLFGHFEDFLFMLLAAAVIFLDALKRVRWQRLVVAFVWVAVVSAVVEAVGATTGFPFGSYHYTENFGPRIGVLPLAIPLAWWVVIYPLFALAREALPGGGGRHQVWRKVGLAALVGGAATLVDVALEPMATLVAGYWEWEGGGAWYGVPLQNFAGWFGTAFVIALGLTYLLPNQTEKLGGRAPYWVLASVIATCLVAAAANSLWQAASYSLVLLVLWLKLTAGHLRCGARKPVAAQS